MTKVTYVPQSASDPHVKPMNGINFPANVPVELDPKNRAHGYNQLVRIEKEDPVTGRKMYEYKETWVSLIETLKGHSDFQIEGEAPAVRKAGRPRSPKTPDEYRSYAQGWISGSEDADELLQRWDDEANLREKIGVGDDDVSYLRPFFDARLHLLGGSPEKHPLVKYAVAI
jgi:hypothetical protein